MDRSKFVGVILVFGAAVLASLILSDIFRLAEVPDMVVAGLAIMNAGLLAFGITVAAVIEKWRQ